MTPKRRSSNRSTIRHRHGFSLLELVVVLAILAALATVALRSVNNIQSQGRYQQTVISLNNLRDAIVGPDNQRGPDGSVLASGFVADIGRLPRSVTGPDPLGELLASNGLPAFAFVASPADSAVRIGVGWQGPYARLGTGANSLKDGWGNLFQYRDGANAVITVTNVPIAQIRSLAADKTADDNGGGIDGYNLDVSSTIPAAGRGGSSATFLGHVRRWDAAGLTLIDLPSVGDPVDPVNQPGVTYATVAVVVKYFGPDVSLSPPVADIPVAVVAPWNYELTGDPSVSSATGIIYDPRITIGARVIKAYFTYTTSASATPVTVSSSALNVTGIGGGQTVPTLVLPNH